MRSILLFLLFPLVMIGCASPPPIPDYEALSSSIDAGNALVIGSAVDVSLPVADIFVVIHKVNEKEVDGSSRRGHIYSHNPVSLPPGKHTIQIHVNQMGRTGIHTFTINAVAGKTYIARFEPDDHKYGNVWIEEYTSKIPITEKVRIKRPLVRGMVIIL